MPCPNCGFANRQDVNFCENCGHSLTGKSSPAPPPPQVVIVREKKKKRSLPGFVWALIGVTAAILGALLLLGLNVVEVPPVPTTSNLPQPIKEIWQSIDEWQEEERFIRFLADIQIPIPNLSDISVKGFDYLRNCEEKLKRTFFNEKVEYFPNSNLVLIHLKFDEPLYNNEYDAVFMHEYGGFYASGSCEVLNPSRPYLLTCRVEDYKWHNSGLQVTLSPKGAACDLDHSRNPYN
jgi:hypothetical protein